MSPPVSCAAIVGPADIGAGVGDVVEEDVADVHGVPQAFEGGELGDAHEETDGGRVGGDGVVVDAVVVGCAVVEPGEGDARGVGKGDVVEAVATRSVTHMPTESGIVADADIAPTEGDGMVEELSYLDVADGGSGTGVAHVGGAHSQTREAEVACIGGAGVVVDAEIVLVAVEVEVGETGGGFVDFAILVEVARVCSPLDAPLVGHRSVDPVESYEGFYLLRNNAKRRKNAKNVYFNTLIWMMITMSKMCENKLQAIYRCPLMVLVPETTETTLRTSASKVSQA